MIIRLFLLVDDLEKIFINLTWWWYRKVYMNFVELFSYLENSFFMEN